jgi:hypothetical protein
MGLGKAWTKDEESILRYLYTTGKKDSEIANVLVTRDEAGIRKHRQTMGLWISGPHLKKKKVEKLSPPKHADNLPDIGEQLAKIITLLQDVCINQKETYAMFKRLEDAGKK